MAHEDRLADYDRLIEDRSVTEWNEPQCSPMKAFAARKGADQRL